MKILNSLEEWIISLMLLAMTGLTFLQVVMRYVFNSGFTWALELTTVFFAIVNAVKLIPYAALGQLSTANLRISAMLILPAVIGVWLGLKLLRILPQALFYKLITWALLLVSLRLIWTGGRALAG